MLLSSNGTGPPEIYTLSLHDALPICAARAHYRGDQHIRELGRDAAIALPSDSLRIDPDVRRAEQIRQKTPRVLQARLDVGVEKLVFRSLHRSFPPRVRAAVRRRIPTTSHQRAGVAVQ